MLMDVSVGCVPVAHVCEGLESLSCIAGQQQAGNLISCSGRYKGWR